MQLRFRPYTLQFRHPFTIATGSRTKTEVVYTELEHEGIIGYGEAAMPPYVGENRESVIAFLSGLDFSSFSNPLDIDSILNYCDGAAPGNHAAKAAVDIALHDLAGKLLGKPLYELWNIDSAKTPYTCITIGMDTLETVRKKALEAEHFHFYKVKLGGANDKEMIQAIRSVSDKPLMIDANQGWKDKQEALEMIHWLKERNALLVEQPFPKSRKEETAWLRRQSPLPLIADESVQRLADLESLKGIYDGINVKLMKCTGLREARLMIEKARSMKFSVLLGCMSESSCAVTAAAHLSPLADWADLDGPLLITNDLFTGMKISDGKIVLNDSPGIGIVPTSAYELH